MAFEDIAGNLAAVRARIATAANQSPLGGAAAQLARDVVRRLNIGIADRVHAPAVMMHKHGTEEFGDNMPA